MEGLMNGADHSIAASIDAAGAAIGSFALAAFAATNWKMLPSYPLWLTLTAATIAWAAVAVAGWFARKRARWQSPF